MENTETPIELWRLVLSLIAALSAVLLSYHFKLGIESKLALAICRAITQLLLLGFILLNFIFSVNSPVVVAAYLTAMLMIAATEVVNRQVRTYKGHFWDALLSCMIGGGCSAVYAAVVVFNPTPWWNPKVFIPTSGMIIGNSVTGPAVAIDRLLSEVSEKKHEAEVRLALGAVSIEALLPAVRAAVLAALMPHLNMLSIVGVVSIPGMMTGQLLGGSTPLIAAEYQMAILFLITATTSLATYVTIVLAVRNAVMSVEHRLTPSRILTREGPKLSIDVAILKGLHDSCAYISSCCQKRCCLFAYCAPLCGGTGTNDATLSSQYSSLPISSSSVEMTRLTELEERDTESLICTPVLLHRTSYRVIQSTLIPACTSQQTVLTITELNIRSGDLKLFDERGFNFSLQAGQRVTLEGSSGLGKTRLLRAIAQLDESESGSMSLNIHSTETGSPNSSITLFAQTQANPKNLLSGLDIYFSYALWRSRLIYIPQALPPISGTPQELVTEALGYKSRNGNSAGRARVTQDLSEMCARLESDLLLSAGKMQQQWSLLSGGERQRAIIACGVILCQALMPFTTSTGTNNNSDTSTSGDAITQASCACVLLLDEPTAACDELACAAVEKVLVESGVACFIVTHDNRQAERLAHTRILFS